MPEQHILERLDDQIDWDYISTEYVPTRTAKECLIRWIGTDHPIINNEPWSSEESQRLARIIRDNGTSDWTTIASMMSEGTRTLRQCFQHYQRRLNPNHVKKQWTPDEDFALKEAVQRYGEGNWTLIAQLMGGRTASQVLHRWTRSVMPGLKNGKWTAEEDAAIRAGVKVYGFGRWKAISEHIHGRTDVKVRERYCNILDPAVMRGKFTAEESLLLLKSVAQYGPHKWSLIANSVMMGKRTDYQC
ncbi:hypothetical protein GQ42DRAFT_126704, partial [Ramicandelaber brevisporus]